MRYLLLAVLCLAGCTRGDWSIDTNCLPHTPASVSTTNPGYDADGNLIVPPEIKATYHMPDVHAGLAADWEAKRLRPVLEMEVLEFKAPYIRTNTVGIMAGEDLVAVHLSHQWTSIFEVSTGMFFGYDTEIHHRTFGLNVLVIKF